MLIEDSARIEEQYADLLSDESRLQPGFATALLIPGDVSEAAAYLSSCDSPVTVSGGRSGITGGAVPEGGTLLSTAGLQTLEGPFQRDDLTLIRVGAGVVLSDLRARLAPHGLFYPPDPTEESASLGGTLATNASGARSYRYGSTREHVQALEIVTAAGEVMELGRGRTKAEGGFFRLPDGRSFPAPDYALPAAKCAAGYHSAEGMDLIDLFIGSEGTLAVITAAELVLLPAPQESIGLLAFLPDEASAFTLADRCAGTGLESLEYFDAACLRLLAEEGRLAGAPQGAGAAVLIEQVLGGVDMEEACLAWEEKLSAVGSSLDQCLYRLGESGLRELKEIRHALPEAVNNRVSANRLRQPSVYKLSTDTALPSQAALQEYITGCRAALAESGLAYYVFGHLGEHHLHINMLPELAAQMETGRALAVRFAAEAVRLGGSVSGEHGIGRLKRDMLALQFGPEALQKMREIKSAWDPRRRLNRGVLFSP